MPKRENFDEREIFRKEIEPMTDRIQKICQEHSIPMNIVIVPASFGESSMVMLTGLNPRNRHLHELSLIRGLFLNDKKMSDKESGFVDTLIDALKELSKERKEKKENKDH